MVPFVASDVASSHLHFGGHLVQIQGNGLGWKFSAGTCHMLSAGLSSFTCPNWKVFWAFDFQNLAFLSRAWSSRATTAASLTSQTMGFSVPQNCHGSTSAQVFPWFHLQCDWTFRCYPENPLQNQVTQTVTQTAGKTTPPFGFKLGPRAHFCCASFAASFGAQCRLRALAVSRGFLWWAKKKLSCTVISNKLNNWEFASLSLVQLLFLCLGWKK